MTEFLSCLSTSLLSCQYCKLKPQTSTRLHSLSALENQHLNTLKSAVSEQKQNKQTKGKTMQMSLTSLPSYHLYFLVSAKLFQSGLRLQPPFSYLFFKVLRNHFGMNPGGTFGSCHHCITPVPLVTPLCLK